MTDDCATGDSDAVPTVAEVGEFFAGVLGMLAAMSGVVIEHAHYPESVTVVCYTPNNGRFAMPMSSRYAHLFEGIPREDNTRRLDGYTHAEGMAALWEMNRYWLGRRREVANARPE